MQITTFNVHTRKTIDMKTYPIHNLFLLRSLSLRKKYQNTGFFWSLFSPNAGKYGIEKNSAFRHFPRSVRYDCDPIWKSKRKPIWYDLHIFITHIR